MVNIAEAVAEPDAAGRSFHATRLRPAFNGRSTSNAPFLAAALVAEGLLAKEDEDGRKVMLRSARTPESWPAFLRRGKSKGEVRRGEVRGNRVRSSFRVQCGRGRRRRRG